MTGKSNHEITVYQKPTCTKCRSTMKILKERGASYKAINYFESPIKPAELRGLLSKLGLRPRDILRKDEQVYRDLGLAKKELTDDDLIELICKHPDLMQRPIVVKDSRAVLGRPPENVEELL